MPLFDEFYSLIGHASDKTGGGRVEQRPPTALTVSAILDITMMTGSRLRQKAATVSLLSTSLSFACELRTPMS